MIQIIGLMVGAYIVTRMVSLLLRKKDGEESIVTRVFAVITVIVAVIGIASLLTASLPK